MFDNDYVWYEFKGLAKAGKQRSGFMKMAHLASKISRNSFTFFGDLNLLMLVGIGELAISDTRVSPMQTPLTTK